MTRPTSSAVEWLATFLALRHFDRITHLRLTIRTFATAGNQYRCGNGPWRDTLPEAIEAHKAAHVDAGDIQE